MKLLQGTKSKITKNENGENLPYFEITETVLIHSNVIDDRYYQESCKHLSPINRLVNY